ncbi:MAG: YdcF family protein [Bacteroidetes bacterium]|nr:YdcF family protein [Bacteroidota bacterium]
MFFYLSKLAYFLTTPIVWIFILCIIALCLRNKKTAKKLFIIAGALLILFTNPFLASQVTKAYEYAPINARTMTPQYKYALVLGGFTDYDKSVDRIVFQNSSDRLWQALWLYKQGKVKKIILSGGEGRILQRGYTESESTRDFLVEIGIPADDIIVENQSRNTFENIKYSKQILDSLQHSEPVLLVTSATHLPRAMACARKAGLQTHAFSTDYFIAPEKYGIDYFIIPDSMALERWSKLIREIIGFAMYKIAGYA